MAGHAIASSRQVLATIDCLGRCAGDLSTRRAGQEASMEKQPGDHDDADQQEESANDEACRKAHAIHR